LGGRAVYLSVGDDYRNGTFAQAFASEIAAEGRLVAASEDRSERGAILGADGQTLATSLKAAEIVATPYQIEAPKADSDALAGILGLKPSEVEARLTKKDDRGNLSGYSVVASEVEPEKAHQVEILGLPGITVKEDSSRVYPNGPFASQLLGNMGENGVYGGVEASQNGTLKSGKDVRLTIHTAVQQELERSLADAAREHRAQSAQGVVMRIEDGAIVALANTPGYDNNQFGKAPGELQRNRVLTDPFEPGSTFKAFTMAAAIDEGAVTQETSFTVPDHMPVADIILSDSEPHETKYLNPAGILAESSNVGTVQVAQSLGAERLHERIERFGFGEKTGVNLYGEDPGTVPPLDQWSGSSIANIPIGQGLTVTPLQLAAGYASIANGGTRVIPHVAEGAAPEESGPRVISEETSSIVRGMLEGVVEEGTGELARIPGYSVAGKTGTAEKVDPATGLYGGGYVTSFIGFAPTDDPEYLTLVIFDDPQTTYWGEVVAAPAFQKVMSFTLEYFNVPPDRKTPQAPTAEGRVP
jgi:cell division protein FtsI/penicillin-binding protein 2